MSGFLKVLLIILAIILLIILLLSFKLKIEFVFRNKQAHFYIRYLFLKFPLSQKKVEKKKAWEKSEDKNPREKTKKGFFETVSETLRLISGAGRIITAALRLHKAEIILKAKICSEDAASCAIEVGKNQAFIHSALGVLGNIVEIKKKDISVFPDYKGSESDYDLYAVIYSRPINLLFNIRKFLGELMTLADALPNKK